MNLAQQLKTAKEERSAALDKIKALYEKIESKTWSEDTDAPALEALKTEVDLADKNVQRLEDAMRLEMRSAGWTSSATTEKSVNVAYIGEGKTGDNLQNIRSQYRVTDAILAATGKGNFEGLVREMHEEGLREAREARLSQYGSGVMIPYLLTEKRDLVAGTTTTGGYTVQTDVERLIPFLDPRPIVARMGATMLMGLQGNIDFPRNDGTATATWDTEQATATETTPTFDRVQMSPNRLAAYTEYSLQLLRQSTIGVEAFVRNRLMQARDNALDLAALNGGGGSEPTGITGVSGVNTISIAASPTWANIVKFETEIAADDADFGNLAYLTTPSIAGILKQVKRDVAGNGFIWEGPNNGSGTINGYRAYVSTLVPTTGGAHYMFFGNWSKLLIGQWGGMELTADPYTRMKDATVQVVLNCWHDVAVEHGQAFAYSSSVHPS
jgi:HK97 family phage major capsid protein